MKYIKMMSFFLPYFEVIMSDDTSSIQTNETSVVDVEEDWFDEEDEEDENAIQPQQIYPELQINPQSINRQTRKKIYSPYQIVILFQITYIQAVQDTDDSERKLIIVNRLVIFKTKEKCNSSFL